MYMLISFYHNVISKNIVLQLNGRPTIALQTYILAYFTYYLYKGVLSEMSKKQKKIFENLPAKDRPDMMESENISIYDMHEDMATVDQIPVHELNRKVLVESNNDHLNLVSEYATLNRNSENAD